MNLQFKFIFFLVVICLGYQTSYGQRRTVNHLPKYDMAPYHFGFILAGNQKMLTWKPVENYQSMLWLPGEASDQGIPNASYFQILDISPTPVPGFAVGIVGNLRLGNHLDLRFIPTLALLGDLNISYTVLVFDILGNPINKLVVEKIIRSTTVDFPFHLKYRSKRLNNFAAYVLAGGKYSIEMASNRRVRAVNNEVPVKVDRNDFAAEAGVGFDFYTPYFKFGTELKMSYGFKNILVKDDFMYSQVLDRLNNKVFQLSFTFE